jgi:hypothetical protein
MRIDSSGNVGIGTSSPSTYNGKLVTKTSNQAVIGYFGGTTYATRLGADASYATVEGVDAATGISSWQPLQIGGSLLKFDTNGTERMRITSAGNVGIGLTNPGNKLQVAVDGTYTANIASNSGNGARIVGTDYGNSVYYPMYVDGSFVGIQTSGTERMRIDSSGNVLVGATSAVNSSKLLIAGVSGSSPVIQGASGAGAYLHFYNNAQTTGSFQIGQGAATGSDNIGYIYNNSNAATVFGTNGTERMRIAADGSVNINTSVGGVNLLNVINNSATGYGISVGVGNNSSNLYRYFEGYDNTVTQRIAIFTNGDVKNTNNSYGSLSDVKLKQDIVDAASQWDDIKALRVRKYRFKDNPNGQRQIGLIAQEAELISAGLIEESPDEERDADGKVIGFTGETTKSIKYSVLYMKAVKALQEAMERIETLETRLNALSGK